MYSIKNVKKLIVINTLSIGIKKYGLLKIMVLITLLNYCFLNRVRAYSPEYDTNPFPISIEGKIYRQAIFVADLNNDNLMDYTYRDTLKLYTYDHYGTKMWSADIMYPGADIDKDYNYNHSGTKHGAADVDGDGQVEIVALNDNNEILIYTGITGFLERTVSLPPLGKNQKACHITIVNLRGQGDRDVVVQTCDINPELHDLHTGTVEYYVNRSLIALDLENEHVLWKVEQDADFSNGYYEGYWGQAHGPHFCADVDEDGLDEVIGGNMIQENGSIINLGFSIDWVNYNKRDSFLDHLDCIAVGDFRPDLPGLEWIITDEDKGDPQRFNTTMMSHNGIVWEGDGGPAFGIWNQLLREPQNVCAGNFDINSSFCEVWVRSRLGGPNPNNPNYTSQRPWIFNYKGNFIQYYQTANVLPGGFNTHPTWGNSYGLESIWTIDWTGDIKEYIAGKARYVNGHIGIFNPIKCNKCKDIDCIWSSMSNYNKLKASMLYVADVAGDSREEIIVYDTFDKKLKVFWNEEENRNQYKPNKWGDPLYRRLKQNWNYYSPGSYTSGGVYPLISDVSISDVTINSAVISWTTDDMSDSQVEYGETISYDFITAIDTTMTTNHSVQVTGLSINKDYHFRVISRNIYDKPGFSRDTVLTLIPFGPLYVTNISVKEDKHFMLTWEGAAGIESYNVYRGTTAYFVPDKEGGSNRVATNINDEEPSITNIQWTDRSVFAGDVSTNYFYVITALIEDYETDPSNVMGAFDFSLSRNFNSISLPLVVQGVSNASQFMEKIPGCTSVIQWNSNNQRYEQYMPDSGSDNFTVKMGYPYYVQVAEDTVLTFTGNITSPSFSFITNGTTSFNGITVPLDKTGITTAAELCADISGCNCAAYWDAGIQGFIQYYTALPGFNNFDVKTGYPYYVNVTSNIVWPSDGSPKQMVSHSKTIESINIPHLVWGECDNIEDNFLEQNIRFRAYITEPPEEILTETSPGCTVAENIWIVQCASFPDGWDAGDILHVELIGNDDTVSNAYEIELSYEPGDKAGEAMSVKPETPVPSGYNLRQNYPNPLNPFTTIEYQIPEWSRVKIKVYNSIGQKVIGLLDEEKDAGYYEIKWMGLNENGMQAPSGLYTIRMESDGFIQSRKMILVR
jgi:hypothetical protein